MVSRQLIFQIHKVQEKKMQIAIIAGKAKVLLFKPRLFFIKITVIFGDLWNVCCGSIFFKTSLIFITPYFSWGENMAKHDQAIV